jgi:CubicO group peptidase (beta-lactamase class C family)
MTQLRTATHRRAAFSAVMLCALAASAHAGTSYDFSQVTQLCQGALVGINVTTPVPGFDLLLLKDGREVFHVSFGAWSLDRIANCDSATKTLSGGLIMSLTDSSPNPFSLDTRISTYVPAFSGAKSTITIRQAFSHTSGLANSTALSNPTITLQQAASLIAVPALQFTPGSAFSYGGSSMHAAGAAAEVAGGLPWNTLFAQRITGPLNMPNTRFVLSGPQNPRIAGGCESTASEFGSFMEMLRRRGVSPDGRRILSEGAVSQMFTRQTAKPILILNTPIESPFTDGADYGVGVWLDERDAAGNLLGAIAAGARGFSSWIDFDDGLVGVLATDTTNSGNIQPLLYMIRSAAQNAVRSPIFLCAYGPCPADFDASGGTPDSADISAFFTAWLNGDDCADVNLSDGTPDLLDIDAFFTQWLAGSC